MESQEAFESENIVCPYCKAILVDNEEIGDYEICSHTIFVATDCGFEFIREDMKEIINENAINSNYDAYTASLPIKGIRIAHYTPAPSFFGVYWGFVEK